MDEIEARKAAFKSKLDKWFPDKYSFYLILLLVVSIIIRLYYFKLTSGQALWWDEAEYLLKAKNIALGTPESGFWYGRPILFPVISSLFYLFGFGEISIRIFLLVISLVSILLVYLVGKQLFSKKVALVGAFFYSLVYINLFYTMRIMVDVFHIVFGLFAFYLFFTKKSRNIWFVLPILALGTLLRFTTFFFFVILLAYVLFTEKGKALRNKDYWISAGLAILVSLPYLIWSWVKLGHPLYAILFAGGGAVSGITFSSGLVVLRQYIDTFPSYFHSVLLSLFLIGLLMFIDVFIGFDLILKNKDRRLSHKFLLLLWILIPLLYFGFGVSHYEDRYIFMTFPAIFFLIGLLVEKIQEYLSRHGKIFSTIFLIAILIVGGFQLISHSDSIIKARVDSFGPIKQAGEWIKDNSFDNEQIMTKSRPQITYYSERETFTIPNDEKDFVGNFTNIRPRYVMVSIYESHPQWSLEPSFADKYRLQPIIAFPSIQQPEVIIYQTGL